MNRRAKLDQNPQATAILRRGDPHEVRELLAGDFDIVGFRHGLQYDALMTWVFGRDIFSDPHLLETLDLLIAAGAPLNGESPRRESALSVLSRVGRFDAVQALLSAGADERLLQWTPLARAVALDELQGVVDLLSGTDALETSDRWSRTPYLLALARGRTAIAELLLKAGANAHAKDHVGRGAIFHAVASRNLDCVSWLLARGAAVGVDDKSESGGTALADAVASDDTPMIDLLLASGADPNHKQVGFSALASARSLAAATRLLQAGADPRELSHGVQRLFTPQTHVDGSLAFAGLATTDVERDRTRRFGTYNGEPMPIPFWEAMVRSGIGGYQAADLFGLAQGDRERPVWCAERFGQSMTLLADGRVVQVAGEHEDGYHPDFCIYNDVFVHHPDGRLEIFGYPKSLSPPTDFHSATQVQDRIVLIGSLGYGDERAWGSTPVYVLDTHSWRIETMATTGESPGWISGHLAALTPDDRIVVSGGQVMIERDGQEQEIDNVETWVLALPTGRWHCQTR